MSPRDQMLLMANAQGSRRAAAHFGMSINAVNQARRRQRKQLGVPAIKRRKPDISSAFIDLLTNEWVHTLPMEHVKDVFMRGVHAVYEMPRRDMLAARHKYQTNKKTLDGITVTKPATKAQAS